MADTFTNARPYYDVTFPTSGDSFSISKMRNALQGLGFMDFVPLQPRAHNPQDTKIMVRGRDASAFYNPIYAGDSNTRLAFSSGDSPAMAAPTTNPRIDIVYLTASGDIKVITGTEAVSPTLPTLSPSGDSRLPIAAIWLKPSMTKIVNFEDKDSNSGDSYIYQDLRPFLRSPGAGAAVLGSTVPVAPSGDAQAASGTATTAARADHIHGGLHTVLVRGTGDGLGNAFSNMQGDVEFAGGVTQSNRRITVTNVPMGSFRNLVVSANGSVTQVKVTFDELVLQDQNMRAGWDASKSITIDITVAGAGGLDGGSEQANKIYYIWIIRNSNTGVVNGILSTSEVTPTMPSGFNQKALISAVGNDNSSNFINFTQTGRKYCFAVWATMASGNVGITPWVAVSMTPTNMTTNPGFVAPALSTHCFGLLDLIVGSGTIIATNDNTVAADVTDATNKFACGTVNLITVPWELDILTANTLYWGANTAAHKFYLHGFEVNKIS